MLHNELDVPAYECNREFHHTTMEIRHLSPSSERNYQNYYNQINVTPVATALESFPSTKSNPQNYALATDSFVSFLLCFSFQLFTAAFIASSANIEQCSLTGGSFKCAAISVFLIANTSSTFFPLIHSVATELDAMADPQPNVLNLLSSILPFSSTRICSFITSPQAGAPTSPYQFTKDKKRRK
uniref:Uncharacterized protein n=1 Tax=Odontella aurita TaxID=265563 RepID=A0A7S4MF26_9STRA|mmetsp:Transcript_19717/g.57256  ORF Transcript_19717/g.57256 Transcript_19717/m.57256 type:complete len:184 (+) Transcript_19717:69-620(+)